jgi:hypothetical protein
MRSPLLVFLLLPLAPARAAVRLPARFEPYQDGYLARTSSGTYFLTPSGALRVSPQLEMRLEGANAAPRSERLDANFQLPQGTAGTVGLEIILQGQGNTNFVPLYVQ